MPAAPGPTQPPRGTRDFGPDEMDRRRRLEDRLRRVLHSFNYREVQTPTFEDLDLFLAKSGPGIRDEIYAFKDKGGRDLCLRPELTAPVMRFYFHSELKTTPKPLRLFYFGPCYRYDRPQEGRFREFWQLGVEVVGDDSAEAHAELLWLAFSLLRAAGLENLAARVGHLAVLRTLIEQTLGVPESEQGGLMRLIDKKDLEGLKAALAEMGKDAGAVDAFLAFFGMDSLDAVRAAFAGTPRTQTAYAHLETVFALLRGFGADLGQVRFDPTIARGLDYYSGLVFELDCPDLGAQKQLLGGGEYDLSAVFGAAPVPTAGFGLGFDRTLVALDRTNRLPWAPARVDAFVAALSPAGVAPAQRVANELRGLDLRVEVDLGARGPKRPLQRAAGLSARFALLVGDREVERGVVAVKDLDAGLQTEIPLEKAGTAVLGALAKGAAPTPAARG